ncbi:MAG: alpha/beta hydrolase [Aureliella sp.]
MMQRFVCSTAGAFSVARVTCACAVLVAVGLAGPLAAQERAPKRPPLPTPDREVVYKQAGDRALKLFVFDSPGKSTSERAAIVFFFGGGWQNGSPEQFYPHARALADRGMLAVCADYRVHSRDRALVIDCVADAQDALLYVHDHAQELKIDPKRIVAAGGSAGGHLAAAVATLPYRGQQKDVGDRFRPHALVLFNPALVLAPLEERQLTPRQEIRVQGLVERMGDKPEAVSPYHHLSKSLPPTLILHGEADTTVPYATVEAFAERAKELGADCTLVGYPGQTHGFFNYSRNREQYQATSNRMIAFLEKLGDLPAVP